MYPDFSITITRRPDAYFVAIPLWIGALLTWGLIKTVVNQVLELPPAHVISNLLMVTGGFATLGSIGYFTGIAPQGTLEIRGNELRANMRFRRQRVFDLRETTITVEKWIGPGSVRGGPMGPMLVFDQGQTHFRIGCYDYEGSQLLTSVDVGEWLTREAHGATKCADFYALAELLRVHIPRPPGWQLKEVF